MTVMLLYTCVVHWTILLHQLMRIVRSSIRSCTSLILQPKQRLFPCFGRVHQTNKSQFFADFPSKYL